MLQILHADADDGGYFLSLVLAGFLFQLLKDALCQPNAADQRVGRNSFSALTTSHR